MFKLHNMLAADTVELTRWDLCLVLLMKDRNYPWLVLVPQRPDLRDLHDLDVADQATLMAEIARASHALEEIHSPDKTNVAALGNVVSQLHVHVIARFHSDAAWPSPIWNVAPTLPYDAEDLKQTVETLRAALG